MRTAAALPVLTMVCGYPPWLSAGTRTAEDLFAGWWWRFAALGAVPRVLVWDGEGAVGRWRGGRNELTGECQALRGALDAKVLICWPGDPEAKDLVERAHDFLERSFLPGRSFTSPAHFNDQSQAWLAAVNRRPRRALGYEPTDRIAADRAARCRPCHRCHPRWAGARRYGCPATTTCAWMPTTTPSTRQ